MVMINGKSFKGDVVSIQNGDIYIDGNKEASIAEFPEKEIVINGNVDSIHMVSADIKVNGNVKNANTISGDIKANTIDWAKTVSGDVIMNGNKD